jgi:oxygen-independent coproporphyrinogen-3 oxidase
MVIDLKPNELSLYFHIPFCTRKCDYCHFYVIPDKESHKELLLHGLKNEWQRWSPQFTGKTLRSIYFGGGTPSLFGPERIAAIIEWITPLISNGTVEITLEVNPENVTPGLMRGYREAGINRVSMGVQSLDNSQLATLTRRHDAQKAIKAIHQTYDSGVDNISIDLMYELPNQTLNHWKETLKLVRELPISHLSLYNLTIEPHTAYYKRREALLPLIPKEEINLQMYEMAIVELEDMGLQQYEISAFAKPGRHSIHNTGYWIGRDFIGFGPSAFSYWEGKRFSNIANINRYCQALEDNRSTYDFEEKLPDKERRRELLAVAIRLKQGVDLKEFATLHGDLDQETETTITSLIESGLLEMGRSGRCQLTQKGVLFYDTVASDLI